MSRKSKKKSNKSKDDNSALSKYLKSIKEYEESLKNISRLYDSMSNTSINMAYCGYSGNTKSEISSSDNEANGEAESKEGGASNNLISSVSDFMNFDNLKQGFEKIAGISDEYQAIQVTLRNMTNDSKELDTLNKQIFASANRSRISYEDMANSTAKLKMLAGDTFKSNGEALAFTEILNKAFKISGADQGSIGEAMEQMTQGFEKGAFQEGELSTIFESAPMLAQAIANEMGMGIEEIKKVAAEGEIAAAVVKNAFLNASDDVNQEFGNLPKTFGDMGNEMHNYLIQAFAPLSDKLTEILNSDNFIFFINSLKIGLYVVVQVIDLVISGIKILVDNFNALAPVLLIIIGIWALYSLVTFIGSVLTRKAATATTVKTAADVTAKGALIGLGLAQKVFNLALAACPIAWIIVAIVAFIAIIYASVTALNKWAGTSFSAAGIIMGIFEVLKSEICNKFIFIWNVIAAFTNFLLNVFNNPVASIKILFLDLAKNVINTLATMVKNIENIINKIPGVELNISSGITDFIEGIESKIKAIKDETGYKEFVKAGEYTTWSDAFNKGNEKGKELENKLSGLDFSNLLSGFDSSSLLDGLDPPNYDGYDQPGTSSNPSVVKGTGNGGAIKVDNSEDLDLLRALAHREYIARIAQNTLSPNINITFTGDIQKETDTDVVIGHLTGQLKELLEVAPAG